MSCPALSFRTIPRRGRRTFPFLVGSALLVAAPHSVVGQTPDVDGDPYFGTITLAAGFTDDPRAIEVRAGGSLQASELGSGCRGTIGMVPDLRLHYTAGDVLPLNLYAESDEDLTLVVRGPDGRWHCNDDHEGLHPAVLLSGPQSGRYDIWVGVYSGDMVDGTLFISELTPRFGERRGGSDGLDPDGAPFFETLTLSAGFADDPRTVAVRAGGPQTPDGLGLACRGSLGTRPDVRLHYSAGVILPLNLYATSPDSDLTLVVRRPDGSWVCNDDHEGLHPAVLMSDPQSGAYEIWVGVYGGGYGDATLYISELTPDFSNVKR